MPRTIPVGNGELLITFDHAYRMRDMYYPNVGRYNHTEGAVQRFGVWADGRFAWIEDPSWDRELRYKPDTMVTEVRLVNREMGLELTCSDSVDFNEPVWFRSIQAHDLSGRTREVRVFMHIDPCLRGSPVGNTANFDPSSRSVVLYKEDSYFLFNAWDGGRAGIEHWAIGSKRIGGAEGTWRDAEDGVLGRNAISQGSIDLTLATHIQVPANGTGRAVVWMACGQTYNDVKRRNAQIVETGPDRMITRTEAYWKLWARKEPFDLSPLPEPIRDFFYRSQLILRTQIDNGGAILAANDSDITQFGGDHYSYCWPRDGALVAYALIRAGQSELSRSFFRFCVKLIEPEGYFLHKYNPTGDLASSWHPWVLEDQKVLPIQQDETALVLWALRRHFEQFRDVEFIKPLYERLVTQPAEWMLSYVDHHGLPKPSWDIWEERRGIHTFTVATVIAALEAASAFAHDFGEPDRAVAYHEGAERLRGALKRHLWNPEHKRFARMAVPLPDGTYRLDMTHDSANFALFALGALPADDPKVEADMHAIRQTLWVKTGIGGIARYQRDYFHQIEREKISEVPGNPWVICTLWHAQWLIARAKTIDDLRVVIPYMDWAIERADLCGVLAEQYHPYTGEPLGVSPLTWSHATFIVVVMEYLAKHKQLLTQKRTGATAEGALGGAI